MENSDTAPDCEKEESEISEESSEKGRLDTVEECTEPLSSGFFIPEDEHENLYSLHEIDVFPSQILCSRIEDKSSSSSSSPSSLHDSDNDDKDEENVNIGGEEDEEEDDDSQSTATSLSLDKYEGIAIEVEPSYSVLDDDSGIETPLMQRNTPWSKIPRKIKKKLISNESHDNDVSTLKEFYVKLSTSETEKHRISKETLRHSTLFEKEKKDKYEVAPLNEVQKNHLIQKLRDTIIDLEKRLLEVGDIGSRSITRLKDSENKFTRVEEVHADKVKQLEESLQFKEKKNIELEEVNVGLQAQIDREEKTNNFLPFVRSQLSSFKNTYAKLQSDTKQELNSLKCYLGIQSKDLATAFQEIKNKIQYLQNENERLKKRKETNSVESLRKYDIINRNLLESLMSITDFVNEDVTPSHSNLSISTSVRRTRSLSCENRKKAPLVTSTLMDSTVAIVQKAFQRRQLQIQELNIRLSSTLEELSSLEKSQRKNNERIEDLERQLKYEEFETKTLRNCLEEQHKNISEEEEKIQLLQIERDSAERSRCNLQNHLEKLNSENLILKEEKLTLSLNYESKMECFHRVNNQYEHKNAELASLLNNLQEKESRLVNELNSCHKNYSEMTAKYKSSQESSLKLTSEISSLRQVLSQMENEESETVKSLEKLIDILENEKLALSQEKNELNKCIESLKEKLGDCMIKTNTLAIQRDSTKDILTIEIQSREKIEREFNKLKLDKENIENQLSSITFEKESLFQELIHGRKEQSEMKLHLDQMHENNLSLYHHKTELEIKIKALETDCRFIEERAKAIKVESKDVNEKLIAGEISRKEMEKEYKEQIFILSEKCTLLTRNSESLTSRILHLETSHQSEISNYEKKHEASLKRIQEEMEAEHQQNIRHLQQEQKELLEKYKDNFLSEMKKLEVLHKENLEETKNLKEGALRIEMEKITLLSNQKAELSKKFENLSNEKDSLERTWYNDQSKLNELSSQITFLSRNLECISKDAEDERKHFTNLLKEEKMQKEQFEKKLDELNCSEEIFSDTISRLSSQVSALNDKNNNLEIKLKETENSFSDYRSANKESKSNQTKVIEDLESKLSNFECKEKILLEECENAKKTLSKVQSERKREEFNLSRQIKSLNVSCDKFKMDAQASLSRSSQENEIKNNLQKEKQKHVTQIVELERMKDILERQLNVLNATFSTQENSYQQKILSLSKGFDELREREKALEETRHLLQLSNGQMELELKACKMSQQKLEERNVEMNQQLEELDIMKKTIANKFSDSFQHESHNSSILEKIEIILTKMTLLTTERDLWIEKCEEFKKINEELKVKMKSNEEQCNKMKQKISSSDVRVAHQEEDIFEFENKFKALSDKYINALSLIEDLRSRESATEEKLYKAELQLSSQRHQISDNLNEAQSSRLNEELNVRALEEENQRLNVLCKEKEIERKVKHINHKRFCCEKFIFIKPQ